MTVGWILQPGFPDTTEAGDENVFADAGGITEWGNHTQVIASGIAVQDLRWQIVQEHVRVRKNPRQVIQFTPMFRAAVDDEVRINAKFRVYGADVAIEPEGEERVTLSVIPSD